MMTISYLITLSMLLHSVFSVPTMQPTMESFSTSRQVLSRLYVNTGGSAWRIKKNWLIGNPCAEAWYGLECATVTDAGSGISYTDVISLELPENKLQHSLPSEIGQLSGINKHFRFDGNDLTGSLPSQVGLLSKMTGIAYFWGNSMQGSLPSELGKLSLLTRNFKVSKNGFTGSL